MRKSFVILSAGKPKNFDRSICLFGEEEKLIDRQIEAINSRYSKADIYVCVGFDAKNAINHLHSKHKDVRIIENTNYESSTFESLRISINAINCCELFVIHGDRFFNTKAIDSKERKPFISIDPEDCGSKQEFKTRVGVCHQSGYLNNMSYGLEQVWGGIFYIPDSAFVGFRDRANNMKRYSHLYDLINQQNSYEAFQVKQKGVVIKEI